jgi:hypothetical protein
MTRREMNRVYWREVLIGHAGELKFDMFDVYGAWFPARDAATYQEFIKTLRDEKEDVYVTVEGSAGVLNRYRITAEPDDEINFKII